MAVDTRDKRSSMIGLASPVPRLLPDPDGSFVAADRAMLLFLYSGIEPLSAIGLVGVDLTPGSPSGTITSGSPSGTISSGRVTGSITSER